MRRLRPALLALIWLALLPAGGRAAEPLPLPALTGRVTDLTATLDATQRGRLEAQLAAIERSRGAQVAVLLLPSTQPEAIEAFGIRLAEAWKIGHKGADNGVIVIVAKDDRNMRIEVGYGLEGAIPDAVAKRIIAERMTPRFAAGDFFGGLLAAVEALDRAIGGDAPGAPPPRPAGGTGQPGADTDLFPWLMAAVVAGGVLRSLFGLFGALIAGLVAGGLGFVIFSSWLAAGLAGVAVFILSFFNLLSRGGGFGGGGGFRGGGGGFSGGGGGFGGGGASGRW
ncbi:MAG: TPM domain-containing protein [Sulfuritalea sp.]|nr:TPM domain-containing protein [Sulfuritalea sp.]